MYYNVVFVITIIHYDPFSGTEIHEISEVDHGYCCKFLHDTWSTNTALYHCVSVFILKGGVLFIEQGLSTSILPASDSAGSSISSPTTTDSGLDTCSKATSREDLSDLEQCSSSATTPSTATIIPGPEPDAQVLFVHDHFLHTKHCFHYLSVNYLAFPVSHELCGIMSIVSLYSFMFLHKIWFSFTQISE